MKLSEILSKPFKVKGGGIVNLKGLSKHIVDKEVGGGSQADNGFLNILFNRVQTDILPHPTKFFDGTTSKIIDINDITDRNSYYFLYKKSDIGSGISMAYYLFSYLAKSYNVMLYVIANASASSSYIIDGEEYVTLTSGGPA